ncbi:hypothetical protein BGY98DRAFT_966212, partial [Russula aff. rugulosa BPL654]
PHTALGRYATALGPSNPRHCHHPTIMSSQDLDDYDKLSPVEIMIRDKADRQREAEEQAGMSFISAASFTVIPVMRLAPAAMSVWWVPVEFNAFNGCLMSY